MLKRVRQLVCLGFTILAAGTPASAATLSEAASLYEQAQQENKAVSEAAMRGDEATARQHAQKMTELLQQARQAYDTAGAAAAGDPDVLDSYARLLIEMGDYDLAEQARLRAAALEPENAQRWFALGETQGLLDAQGANRAVRSLRKALSLSDDPESNSRIHAALGAIFLQEGLYALSRESLEAALKEKPDHMGAAITLASIDVREGKIGAASARIDRLGEIPPGSLDLLQRSMNNALADFDRSRRWMDDTAANHLAYAKLLVRAGRMQDSPLPLERAAQLDPNDVVTWNLLGSVYRGLDHVEGARRAFEKSLALNPDQPRTQEALRELGANAATPPVSPPETAPATP
ncbi:MAG: tetratricopeptide repeat protein [Candidatus Hydrogenedentes bacterium]|nr:tetratricopeptide repeat protein [Candidatus Hydrogenedentota bacterium]